MFSALKQRSPSTHGEGRGGRFFVRFFRIGIFRGFFLIFEMVWGGRMGDGGMGLGMGLGDAGRRFACFVFPPPLGCFLISRETNYKFDRFYYWVRDGDGVDT